MIRVLHVVDKLTVGTSVLHGVTRVLSWWIPEYDRNRFQVSVCSLRGWDRAADYLDNLGIRVMCLDKGKFDPLTLSTLLRLVKHERVELLHLHGYGATTFGRLVGLIAGIPCVVHEHMYDRRIPWFQRMADRLLSPATAHSFAVSETVKEFLVKYRGLRPERVEVVYNGVPLAKLRQTSDRGGVPRWRGRFHISDRALVIATVGRLHPIKGQDFFLRAAALVAERIPDVQFWVVGSGDLLEELRALAETLGITEQTWFTGYCEDVPALLSEVDVHVISSVSEGVPMTLFEALAIGVPTVSVPVGGVAEVLKNGETGIIACERTATALADSLTGLLGDPARLAAMKQAAYDDAGRFDISVCVRRLERCYDDLTGQDI